MYEIGPCVQNIDTIVGSILNTIDKVFSLWHIIITFGILDLILKVENDSLHVIFINFYIDNITCCIKWIV